MKVVPHLILMFPFARSCHFNVSTSITQHFFFGMGLPHVDFLALLLYAYLVAAPADWVYLGMLIVNISVESLFGYAMVVDCKVQLIARWRMQPLPFEMLLD
jgi:hypothetical protein